MEISLQRVGVELIEVEAVFAHFALVVPLHCQLAPSSKNLCSSKHCLEMSYKKNVSLFSSYLLQTYSLYSLIFPVKIDFDYFKLLPCKNADCYVFSRFIFLFFITERTIISSIWPPKD